MWIADPHWPDFSFQPQSPFFFEHILQSPLQKADSDDDNHICRKAPEKGALESSQEREGSWTSIILILGRLSVAPMIWLFGHLPSLALPCVPKIWPPDNTCFCSCPPSLPAWLPQPEKAQISSAPTFFAFPHICLFLTFKCGVVLHLFEINYVCLNFFGLGVDRRVCCLLEIQAAIKLLHCHTHNRQLSWKIRADHQNLLEQGG